MSGSDFSFRFDPIDPDGFYGSSAVHRNKFRLLLSELLEPCSLLPPMGETGRSEQILQSSSSTTSSTAHLSQNGPVTALKAPVILEGNVPWPAELSNSDNCPDSSATPSNPLESLSAK